MTRTKLLFSALLSAVIFTSCQREYTCYCMDLTDFDMISIEPIGKHKRSTAKYICQEKQTDTTIQCTLSNPHLSK